MSRSNRKTQKEIATPRLPDGLTELAHRRRLEFEAAYVQVIDDARDVVSLDVLIWGPGMRSKSAVERKRQDIREELVALGHNAMFSEDISSVAADVSQKTKEFAQAKLAQLIIVLVEDSQGALGEAHDFCNHPELAPKMSVMVPIEYKDGYSAMGAFQDLADAYNGVRWYSSDDLERCSVLESAVRRAEALRQIHFRHMTC